MTSFMFATLGSIGFWVVYFTLSLFAVVIIIRTIAPETYSFVMGENKHHQSLTVEYTALLICNFLFWPLILLGILLKLLIVDMLCPGIRKILVSIDKTIPTIKFRKKEE